MTTSKMQGISCFVLFADDQWSPLQDAFKYALQHKKATDCSVAFWLIGFRT